MAENLGSIISSAPLAERRAGEGGEGKWEVLGEGLANCCASTSSVRNGSRKL